MISVYKDLDNPPAILENKHRKERLKKAIQKQKSIWTNNDYAPKAVKKKLRSIYNNKCAYCESEIEHAASLEVEHYRPKTKIIEDSEHKGYYWLGTEWSNLLLACPACNGQSAKGNKFPIQGKRAYQPHANRKANDPPLILERPLLLNPEISNPNLHFYFDDKAKIYGATTEGKATIEICKLNRGPLYWKEES